MRFFKNDLVVGAVEEVPVVMQEVLVGTVEHAVPLVRAVQAVSFGKTVNSVNSMVVIIMLCNIQFNIYVIQKNNKSIF
jgi:hypothetical protein